MVLHQTCGRRDSMVWFSSELPVELRTLRVVAEYGWWYRPDGYAGQGEVLLDIRDGDATHRAISMMMWKPESSVDESIKAACDGLTRWARYRNEASQRAQWRRMRRESGIDD